MKRIFKALKYIWDEHPGYLVVAGCFLLLFQVIYFQFDYAQAIQTAPMYTETVPAEKGGTLSACFSLTTRGYARCGALLLTEGEQMITIALECEQDGAWETLEKWQLVQHKEDTPMLLLKGRFVESGARYRVRAIQYLGQEAVTPALYYPKS